MNRHINRLRQVFGIDVEATPRRHPIKRGESVLIPLGFFKPTNDHRWSMRGDALPPPCQMMHKGLNCPKRAEVAVKRPDVLSLFYFCEQHAEIFR